MIISKIQGGLGNQMFQYSYGRFLSMKYKTNLFLDREFYKFNQANVIRFFLLDKFTNLKIEDLEKKYLNYPIYPIVDNFAFREFEILPNRNYYLDGYWQSEKYFIDIQDQIRYDFSPSSTLLNKLLKTTYIDSNCVSVHIRRTDYIASNGYHPVQPVEYYRNALDVIGDYDHIFVFSDDIKWCRENLKFNNMTFVEGHSEIEDLYLMSLCKNNIIANSSFSWWGAWLNNNPFKKVIAPVNWFGTQTNLTDSDIIPNTWTKI
jgi:hypothetical protein